MRHGKNTLMVLALLTLWLPGRVAAQQAGPPPVDSLLVRLSTAGRSIGYSGEYVHQTHHAGRDLKLKYFIQHWPPDKTVIQFLQPDSLRETVIALSGEQVRARGDRHVHRMAWHMRPGQWLRHRFFLKEIDLLKRNYAVSIEPGPVMLERPTYVVHIQPTRAGRPELRLWVDRQTLFIFKMQRLSPIAVQSELHEYTKIEFTPSDTAEFSRIWASLDTIADARSRRMRRYSKTYSKLVHVLADHDGPILVPQLLPAGFELMRIRKFRSRDRTYMHLLYSDGLAFISLFEYPKTAAENNGARKPHARRHTEFSVVNGRIGEIGYHLVSEVPREELERMAQSLLPIQRVTRRNVPAYYGWAILAVAAAWMLWWQRRRVRR
ncbi:MAG: MucB/RseB C-terminal domain-containing protein [candidate division KSB1 bacterium]|nr:MucB/RseB C-terminal domain-containing protein [candidate division KSB1 bacterium]